MDSFKLFSLRLADKLAGRGAVAEFCRETGIGRSVVDRWINGLGAPGLESLDKVAQALGTTACELIKPEGAEVVGLTPAQRKAIELIGKMTVFGQATALIALESVLAMDEFHEKIDPKVEPKKA